MATILDGKSLSEKILNNLAQKIKNFERKPSLAVILVGDNPASKIYVNNKRKVAEKIGITSQVINYPENITEDKLLEKIKELNNDKTIDAILVQLPLPEHISKTNIMNAISYKKDVDGFTPYNSAQLYFGGEPYVYPCTPKGILLLLKEYNIDVEGRHVVVIGRSDIVGKPMSVMMLHENATVTTCHSHTKDLKTVTKTADIVISAVGKPIVFGDMLKKDCIVIDVGIFRDENGKLRGDVDFESALKVAKYISPVPKGVGPMTITSLMLNTVELYEHHIN